MSQNSPDDIAEDAQTADAQAELAAALGLDDELQERSDPNAKTAAPAVDAAQLERVIEGAILASGEALNVARLQALFDEGCAPQAEAIESAVAAIQERYAGRGFELHEVASGWRFQVVPDVAPWVNRLWEEKPQKYSRALLETLALIAYRQPITRGDIEEVRGVAVSSHIIKTLTERDWVKVVGHRDVPGRPALYATTRSFLDYFNLKSLDELPTLGELKDIDSLNRVLEFDEIPPGGEEDEAPGDASLSAQTADAANESDLAGGAATILPPAGDGEDDDTTLIDDAEMAMDHDDEEAHSEHATTGHPFEEAATEDPDSEEGSEDQSKPKDD